MNDQRFSTMNYLGKLWNKFQTFPEFQALINNIDELQDIEAKVYSGLQKTYGDSFVEFAKQQDEHTCQVLLSIQEIAKSEVAVLRDLLVSTSSFPSDIRQINGYHDEIVRKKKELQQAESAYEASEKKAKQKLASAEKVRSSTQKALERSNAQSAYDEACAEKERLLEIFETQKEEYANALSEYRKTIMQLIISAFESYCTAYMRAMKQLGEIGTQMAEKAEEFTVQDDQSIADLEARLQLLESEQ